MDASRLWPRSQTTTAHARAATGARRVTRRHDSLPEGTSAPVEADGLGIPDAVLRPPHMGPEVRVVVANDSLHPSGPVEVKLRP